MCRIIAQPDQVSLSDMKVVELIEELPAACPVVHTLEPESFGSYSLNKGVSFSEASLRVGTPTL